MGSSRETERVAAAAAAATTPPILINIANSYSSDYSQSKY